MLSEAFLCDSNHTLRRVPCRCGHSKTERPWKSGAKQLVDHGIQGIHEDKVLTSSFRVFHDLHKGDLLTPIRATDNTRRVLIAGGQSLPGGRLPCFPLELPRFRCRNPDCCKNKLPRCNQAFACVVQVRDHEWGCGTSWGRGSEMSDLAPTCRLFSRLNYRHWRTVNDLNPTFVQVQTVP